MQPTALTLISGLESMEGVAYMGWQVTLTGVDSPSPETQ